MNKIAVMSMTAALMLGSINVYAAPEITPEDAMPPRHEMPVKDGRHHRISPNERANKLADKLGLSDEQQQKAAEIRKADFEKMKPYMEQMKELRQKMDDMRQENMKAFEEILTPEQKEKFAEIKAEQQSKKGRGHKHHHRGAPDMPPPAE
ncbi:MAG: Spy/CpxP family protein refolding chaperone [Alphaproteobacteria bacterium]|nr:Spy/CpxP family protein refolding chaperone [Alphaproteobacteria bacterium]